MSNSKAILATLLLVSVLISGCGGVRRGTDRPSPVYDAHSGTQGLEMRLVPNYPPARVYYSLYNPPNQDGYQNPITVMAELWNRGAYDIEYGQVYLSGFDSSIIQFAEGNVYSFAPLEGKTSFNPEGGYTTVEFKGNVPAGALPEGMDHYLAKMVLQSCYEYQTEANPLVCVDPQPYSTIQDKACTAQTSTMGKGAGGGQGAPIAVTAVEEEATANMLYFRIRISNSGGGIALSPGSLPNCPFHLEYNDLNRIEYDVRLGGMGAGAGAPVKCEPSEEGGNVVRLIDGHATVYCTFNMPTGEYSAYETPLQITLRYGYKKGMERTVEIRNID